MPGMPSEPELFVPWRDPETGLALVAPRDRLAFLHVGEKLVPAGQDAWHWTVRALGYNPAWMQGAFWLRDRVSALAGVKPVGGLGAAPDVPPAPGGKLHFFDVVSLGDSEICLTAPDRHLTVLVSVLLDPPADGRQRLRLATSVETRNAFGRAYMIPVAPAHRFITAQMMRRL